MTLRLIFLCVFCFNVVVFCRRHTLSLKGDARQFILASRFGYAAGGSLLVEVNNLPKSLLNHVGFILDRTTNGNIDTRDKSKHGKCMLTDAFPKSESDNVVVLKFERKRGRLLTESDKLFVRPAIYNTVFDLKFVDPEDRKSLKSLLEPVARFLQTKANIELLDAMEIAKTILEFVRTNPKLLAEIEKIVDNGGEKAVSNLLYAFLNSVKANLRSRRSVSVVDEVGAEANQVERPVKKKSDVEKTATKNRNKLKEKKNKAVVSKADETVWEKAVDESVHSAVEPAENAAEAGGDGGGNDAVHPKRIADDSPQAKLNIEEEPKPDPKAADFIIPEPKVGKGVANNVPAAGAAKEVNPPKKDSPISGDDSAQAVQQPDELDPKHEVPQAEKSKLSVPNEVIETVEKAVEVFRRNDLLFPYVIKDDLVSVSFSVSFTSESAAGSYDLYFHNCGETPTDVSITMTEQNPGSFLSVGEQPLCILYAVFGVIYFMLSIIWLIHLRVSKAPVFRIHYLMFAMVFVKACSLAFHAINFYVIGKHGVPEEGWAVMYYISHMTRGFLLFVTILMIGAGWTFIKHAFSRREKHLFAIIIPLQVLANVATIVMEESEQGASRYITWKEIFTVVDLVCCVLILFPVIWSIRHLQAAAQSDGKAAQNLRKLRLFRHFYIMVICYIYFTRIIVYLLKLTIPAHLNWLVELFQELVTLVFLFSIGYKFRPFNDNPYLQVPSDEDEDTLLERFDLEEVWSQSGLTDGVTRLHRPQAINAALTSRKQKANRAAAGLEVAPADTGESDLTPLIRP